MSNTYQIFLISDSTGETLDRIFLSLKAQFQNIEYKVNSYSFTRTENQIGAGQARVQPYASGVDVHAAIV